MAEYKPNPLLIEEINGKSRNSSTIAASGAKGSFKTKGERTTPLSEKQLSHQVIIRHAGTDTRNGRQSSSGQLA
jgi:hypothetical protein